MLREGKRIHEEDMVLSTIHQLEWKETYVRRERLDSDVIGDNDGDGDP